MLDDVEAEGFEARDILAGIGEETELAQAQIAEDLAADAEVSLHAARRGG